MYNYYKYTNLLLADRVREDFVQSESCVPFVTCHRHQAVIMGVRGHNARLTGANGSRPTEYSDIT